MYTDPRTLTTEERYKKLQDRVALRNIDILENKIVTTKLPSKKSIDITNKKFNKLRAIQYIGKDEKKHEYWEFECDCGNRPIIEKSSVTLERTTSCGCVHSDKVSNILSTEMKKHGMTYSSLYWIWSGIKKRCYNPNRKEYPNYGGRGIRMCNEWKNDFSKFKDWAYSNGYQEDKKLSIDRIHNNGDYEPSNCRWVTRDIQALNTRKNCYIQLGEYCFPVSIWSRITGLADSCIEARITRGWNAYDILHTPSIIGRSNSKEILEWSVDPKYLGYNIVPASTKIIT